MIQPYVLILFRSQFHYGPTDTRGIIYGGILRGGMVGRRRGRMGRGRRVVGRRGRMVIFTRPSY